MAENIKNVIVRNAREKAHVDRYNLMLDNLRRKKMERADAAYSEYIIFVGALAAVAEDATVEALKYFRPDAKEKKAIKALPKSQRKAYVKENWPYYQNELKQMLENIDVAWFENVAVKSADTLDREVLQNVMDSAVEKFRRHVYILRQAVKRGLGRAKDAKGRHMTMLEEKSYLYVAAMLWMRVCACHDLRIKMGPTPIGKDHDEEVRQYIANWTAINHELSEQGKPTLPSRYYSERFATAMLPFRPTRIKDMMTTLCDRIIGFWINQHDPLNKDMKMADEIILQKAMSIHFINDVTNEGLNDLDRYTEEIKWIDAYTDATHADVSLSMPMINCTSVRLAGKTTTDHILEYMLRSNCNIGPQMFVMIKGLLLWLDTKLPPAVEPDRPLTDEEKMQKVRDMMYANDAPADMQAEIDKMGDERLSQAWHDALDETHEHFAKRREEELKERQQRAAYEQQRDLQLQQQEPEPRKRSRRWNPEDAEWMYDGIKSHKLTYKEVAARTGRTIAACKEKVSAMKHIKADRARMKKEMKLTKCV